MRHKCSLSAKVLLAFEALLTIPLCQGQIPFVHATHGKAPGHIGAEALPDGAPAPGVNPVCASTPTVSQLRGFGYYSATSMADSASVNLTFVVDASASFTNNSQVVTYRTGQSFECPSTDGKYTVVYGSEFDSGVAISQENITGKVSFAVVAANVTINNSNTQFAFNSSGFKDDSAIRNDGASMAADVSGSGLNVPTFDNFSKDFNKSISDAAAAKVQDPPIVIGWRPIQAPAIADSLARVFALGYIAEGKGCEDAITAFPIQTPDPGPAIRATYTALGPNSNGCDASDKQMQSMAKQLLTGQRIKLP